jgi:hypothetical protein
MTNAYNNHDEMNQGQRRRSSIALFMASLLVAAAPLSAQQPDRSGPPDLGPPPRLELPPIQQLALSNGLRVVLMEKHGVPLVQVNVLVMSGRVHAMR